MSKFKKWFALGALALSLGTVVAPTVSSRTVLQKYYFDLNRFSGITSNFHGHRYRTVPDHYRHRGEAHLVFDHGWNYIRYEALQIYY